MGWYYYSHDVDGNSDDVCSKTEFHDDGTVHRYDGTGGDFSIGHGHTVYNSQESYTSGGSASYDRGPYDSGSIGRSWDERH